MTNHPCNEGFSDKYTSLTDKMLNNLILGQILTVCNATELLLSLTQIWVLNLAILNE